MTELAPHIWTILSGLAPTLAALFGFLKAQAAAREARDEARAASLKADKIIIQTNGTLSIMFARNVQLAAELDKHDIPIPPPNVGEKDAGNP